MIARRPAEIVRLLPASASPMSTRALRALAVANSSATDSRLIDRIFGAIARRRFDSSGVRRVIASSKTMPRE